MINNKIYFDEYIKKVLREFDNAELLNTYYDSLEDFLIKNKFMTNKSSFNHSDVRYFSNLLCFSIDLLIKRKIIIKDFDEFTKEFMEYMIRTFLFANEKNYHSSLSNNQFFMGEEATQFDLSSSYIFSNFAYIKFIEFLLIFNRSDLAFKIADYISINCVDFIGLINTSITTFLNNEYETIGLLKTLKQYDDYFSNYNYQPENIKEIFELLQKNNNDLLKSENVYLLFQDIRLSSLSLEQLNYFLKKFNIENHKSKYQYSNNKLIDKMIIEVFIIFNNLYQNNLLNYYVSNKYFYHKILNLISLFNKNQVKLIDRVRNNEINMLYHYLIGLYGNDRNKFNELDKKLITYISILHLELYNSNMNKQIETKFFNSIDNNFIKKIINYNSNDMTRKRKKEYVLKFLNFYKDKVELSNDLRIKIDSEELYNRIKNNKIIVDIISGSQRYFERNINDFMGYDYSSFIVPPIKCVERYLKEILVQKYPDSIYNTKERDFNNKNKPLKVNFKYGSKLDADSLSEPNYDNCIYNYLTDSYDYKNLPNNYNVLELGNVSNAIQYALCLENSNYKGIFKKSSPRQGRFTSNDFLFNLKFIKVVRNGYFHIDVINDKDLAISIFANTSFWFCKCIEEFNFIIK